MLVMLLLPATAAAADAVDKVEGIACAMRIPFHSFATLFAILIFKYDTAIALAEQRKSIFNLTNM